MAGSVLAAVIAVLSGAAIAHDDESAENAGDASAVRQLIDQQVGGIDKLKVPATDAEIPVPKQPDGTVAYRYETTEAKSARWSVEPQSEH